MTNNNTLMMRRLGHLSGITYWVFLACITAAGVLSFLRPAAAQLQPTTFVACPTGNAGVCMKVGFSYPGQGSSLDKEGSHMLRGYIIWARLVNASPQQITVQGTRYGVELIGYDDRSNATLTVAAYTEMITSDPNILLLGPYGSSLTSAAIQITEAHNKVLLFANAADDSIFERGYKFIFSVSTQASEYTPSGVYTLAHHGARSAVILTSTAAYTTAITNGAVTVLHAAGIERRGIVKFNPGDLANATRAHDLISACRDHWADVFFAFVFFEDATAVIKTAELVKFRPRAIYLTTAPADPDWVHSMGPSAEWLMGPSQWQADLPANIYKDALFGSARQYASKYQAMFNNTHDVSYIAAQSSAAGYALQKALESATTIEQTKNSTQLSALLQKLNLQTFYGPISFNHVGSNTEKPMLTVQVQDGQIRTIAPEDLREEQTISYPIIWTVSEGTTLLLGTTTTVALCILATIFHVLFTC
eukprot:TRINITY_DN7781_c0_g1_i2.p1 TRINITY_DN7781_c0_g1~~TRINITY_DN7781_c0_g1_i2.p1  ORF type:complete len:476 (+),score=65.95 TRINITY_DN7781_c0_g1_i2:12-1439(+)